MNWLALDIGGANIKVANGREYARSYPFPLWKNPDGLAEQLRRAIGDFPPSDRPTTSLKRERSDPDCFAGASGLYDGLRIAVTMTGELADCFESKTAGVRFITRAVCDAAGRIPVCIYLTNGSFVAPQSAAAQPMLAAASNWHALAAFAGRLVGAGTALLVDVGSTTCDIIPLAGRKIVAKGATDTERLLSGELVYTGVERSPVCAIASHVPYRGQNCPLVQEVFAHARDVYLLTGDMDEDPADRGTSDGQPATKPAATLRLARMIGADSDQFDADDAVAAARAIADAQARLLAAAIEKVALCLPTEPAVAILSGHGEFLARAALARLSWRPEILSLSGHLGPVLSRCAPAHAVAVLAREMVQP